LFETGRRTTTPIPPQMKATNRSNTPNSGTAPCLLKCRASGRLGAGPRRGTTNSPVPVAEETMRLKQPIFGRPLLKRLVLGGHHFSDGPADFRPQG
jgi:hypothetical protein